MTEVEATEARDTIEEILARAEAGETVLITRDGRAVARLQPEKQSNPTNADPMSVADRQRLFQKLDEFRRSIGAWATVDELLARRHEGHRYR